MGRFSKTTGALAVLIAMASSTCFAQVDSCGGIADPAQRQDCYMSADCSSVQDPIQQAQCLCYQGGARHDAGSSSILDGQSKADAYLTGARNVLAGKPDTQTQDSGLAKQVAQGCYGLTKGAFDSILGLAKGFLTFGGIDFSSLFTGVINNAEGQLCSNVNKAIMGHTALTCPRVNIPGFPINCNANLNLSSNGVSIGTSGSFGTWSANGGSNVGLNGVGNVSGGYNAGPGQQSYGTTGVNAPTVLGTAASATSTATCWLTGTGC